MYHSYLSASNYLTTTIRVKCNTSVVPEYVGNLSVFW